MLLETKTFDPKSPSWLENKTNKTSRAIHAGVIRCSCLGRVGNWNEGTVTDPDIFAMSTILSRVSCATAGIAP